MLILTSPAKTMDYDSPYPKVQTTKPQFLDHTESLWKVLKEQKVSELEKTLHVSKKLAELNYERFQTWSKDHSGSSVQPSIFTFKGDVFQQLDLDQYKEDHLEYLNEHLITLSGFYGYLRAFDLMKPYRLEMGLQIKQGDIGKLQKFWKPVITPKLHEHMHDHGHQFVLNLASKEYSDAVDLKNIGYPVIDVIFLQQRHGELKTFGLLAKRARGMMIDYCAKQKVTTKKQVEKFNINGYKLVDSSDTSVTFLLEEK